jgi:hypothetical protein
LGRILSILILWATVMLAQEPSSPKTEDNFFAGSVASMDAQKIVVSRFVAAKREQHTFRMTPDTKVEGKLKAKVRVTVRYNTEDDGTETATLIVVRTSGKPK